MATDSQLYQLYHQNIAKNAIGSNNPESYYSSNHNKSIDNLSSILAPKNRLDKDLGVLNKRSYPTNVANMQASNKYLQTSGNS